jgi:hypothetical protein
MLFRLLPILPLVLAGTAATAGEARRGGKLLLTGGVSTIEGSGGAGLATWSMIAGDETEDGIGGKAHVTGLALSDFTLRTYGAAVGIRNRVELSYARQDFDTGRAGAALGLGHGFTFGQDIFGLKVRLIGDAVYDQDRALPQISVAIQYKRSRQDAIVRAVGGQHTDGVDYVLSASKVLLSHSAVIGGSLRLTKANQFGLLGYGGDKQDAYRPQFEGSAGLLLSSRLLAGGEYRTKPDNLGFAKEDDAYDAFLAWAVQRHVTVTLAYVDAGHIATFRRQHGALLSLQGNF